MRIKEKFVPVQINQDLCLRCERCLHTCKNKAIYFENSVRLVDYSKCKACLSCVQVCPRNAITVTSVNPKQVVSMKIDRKKCNMCLKCVKSDTKFCPNNLFYVDTVEKEGKRFKTIKFKFNEIAKCQGCLKCEMSCPEHALKAEKFEA